MNKVKESIDTFRKQIEEFNVEIKKTKKKINKYNNAIEALQDICDHKNEDGTDALECIGNDSHKNHYKCTICGYKKSI